MSQENVDSLRAVYEQWGRGNFQAGLDLYDPHVLFIPLADAPERGPYLGRESISEFMRTWLEPWTNLTVTADEFIEAENSVVVSVHQRGVGQESGAPAEVRFFQVWSFRGPAVTRLEHFRDRAEALEAVGLSE